jgi:hypothetical protein
LNLNILKKDLKYYQKHSKDVAKFANNLQYRALIEGAKEISRSGLLEKRGFKDCLDSQELQERKWE